MKKLTISSLANKLEKMRLEDLGKRLQIEIFIKGDDLFEPAMVVFSKSEVAKLVEFLNGLELAE
jgi:hypothetical protein